MSAEMEFCIAPHVCVCVTAEGSVILDLKRDKYLGIGRPETELLAEIVPEWPKPAWAGKIQKGSETSRMQGEELCRSLSVDGLLVRGPPANRETQVSAGLDMTDEWISVGDELEVERDVRWRDVQRFLAAFIWARLSLGWRPLIATIDCVRKRKIVGAAQVALHSVEILQIAATVEVFRKLRPFVFAAESRCLLHALTLVRFLSYYQLYPDWVVGVATQPWGAHSWVQWENLLLDSNPEKVCGYKPILVT